MAVRAVPQLCSALCNCAIALYNCQWNCASPVKISEASLWREVNLTYKLLSAKMNGARQRADKDSGDLTSFLSQLSLCLTVSVHSASCYLSFLSGTSRHSGRVQSGDFSTVICKCKHNKVFFLTFRNSMAH